MQHSEPLSVLFLLLSARLAAAAEAIDAAGAPDSFPAEPLLPCLEEVLPCTAYLKTARRPAQTCCTAMQRAAATQLPCLCRLLADRELLGTFNVTREQVFRLPARCGLPVGCRSNGAGSPEPVVEAPPPPVVTPRRPDGDSSGGSGFRSSVGCTIASVLLGEIAPIAALFLGLG